MATIFTEGFESDGSGTRYTLSMPEFHTASSATNDDFFGRSNGSSLAGVAFTSGVSYASDVGNFHFAANDTDTAGLGATQTITFSSIDISGLTNLNFSGLFAEDDFVDGNEDWDTTSLVYVEVSIDGGAFTKILQFATANLNNSAPLLDTNFDGIGDSTELTETFQNFSAAIAGTGSTLDFRVVMENLNFDDEDIAFDNLTIFSTTPATLSTTFLSGIDESIEGDVSAQIVLSFDQPPGNLSSIRVTPNSADVDVGSGAGNSRVFLISTAPITITATAVNDALVEGDETALLSFELGGTLDPNFSLNPVPDLAIRLVDSDANLPPESAYLLHQEGFETNGNGTRYTTSVPEFSDGFEDFFIRTNGSNISANYDVSGEEGSFYFAGQDIDQAVAAGSQAFTQSLSITGIDISDFDNLVFSALFAEDDNGNLQSLDSTEGIRIRAQIDGGGFVNILGFEAGGDQSNEVGQLDTDLNGSGDGAALTDTFTRYSAAIAGTGSNLDLQIELAASFAQEDFAIDDIRVTGDAVADLDIFTAGFVDVVEGGQGETIRADVRGTPDAGDIIELVATWDPTEYRVNGNSTGTLTTTYTGVEVLNGQSLGEVFTLTAVDDADDEISPQLSGQNITFDVVSADDAAMDAIGPQAVNVRVWDNDGDTGADGDGAFLLHQEGFETQGNGVRYTLSSPEFNVQNSIFGGDWFTRSNGTDLQSTSPGAETWGVTASEGSFFFSGQDINNPAGDGLSTKSLTITGIDIDGFENLHFQLDVAEDDQDDGLQDWNGATDLSVEVQIDGGGFVEILSFRNTGQTDAEPGHDTDLNNLRDGVALQQAFQEFGADILGTGDDLDVRINFNDFLFSGEDFAIDDIRVTGDAVADLDIFTAGFVDVVEGGQGETIRADVRGTPDAGDIIELVATWDPTEYRVNGNSTGTLTTTYTGVEVLNGQSLGEVFTLTAVDDADDEISPQLSGQNITFDVVSADDAAMDAIGPQAVNVRVWDNDGDTGADGDGAFLLHQEGFETQGNGVRYTLSSPEFNVQNSIFGGDWFTRSNGTDLQSTSPGAETWGVTASEGSFFFSGQDINNPAGDGLSTKSLTITGIDIDGFENLHFQLDVAEDDQDDGLQDWNGATDLSVEVQIDGGGFVEILSFRNTGQTDAEPGHDTDLNNLRDGVALQQAFQEFGADILGTGDDLDVRINFNDFLFSGEDFAIDDIRVTGDAVADLDIFTAGFVDVVEGGQGETIRADVRGTPDAGDIIELVATWDPTEYRVNGNSTGTLTTTYTGVEVLNGQSLGEVFTLTAVDDADDEISPQLSGQNITFDVVSADDAAMDAIGPQAVNVRVWDNDGDTGADGDGAFLLHQEGFETQGNGVRYTLSSPEFNVQNSIFGGDWFTRSDGSNLQSTSQGAETWGVTASEGSFFFSGQDINNPAGDGLSTKSLTITGIDIDGFENLHFQLDVAEDDQDDGLQDWNGATDLSVEVQIDGGGFVEILSFRNTGQTDAEPGHDTDLNNLRDGVALQQAFQEFGGDILGTGDDLDVRINFNDFLFSGEDFAIDDIRVTGDAVADLDIFTAGFVDVVEGGQGETIRADVRGTPDAGDIIELVATWDPTEYRVNGNSTGTLTTTYTGVEVLNGQSLGEVFTLTAVDDADDEISPQLSGQNITFDVVSADDAAMDAIGPQAVNVRVWDNDGDTGADGDGAFLLHQEGFETQGNGVRYTLSSPEFNVQNSIFGGDWFTRSNGTDLQSTSPGAETWGVTASEGSFFFSGQDINNPAGDGLSTKSLTITGIDIDGFENLHFQLDVAEDDQDDGLQDWNGATDLSVEVQIDGGGFVEILSFRNTGQTDAEPGHDTDLNNLRDGVALQQAFQEFGADILGTGDDLDVRINFNDFLFSGEDFAIDDIRVTGDAVADLDIFTAGFVDVVEGGQGETIRADVRGTPDAGDTIQLVATWDPTEYRVNGNSTGTLTTTYTGVEVLNGQSLGEVFTLTAVDDADDEISPQLSGQNITFDVVSADDAAMDAIGPQAVNVRVWDNDGDTGADGDGAFLLHQEGFETQGNGVRYTLSSPEFNVQNSIFGGDWFTRSDGSNLQSTSQGAETWGVTASEGSFFFSGQDINNPAGDGLSTKSLTITGIDIDGFENLHFQLDVAEDDQDDGLQDWNGATDLSVEVQIDGGGFVEILSFRNTGQTDAEPGHDTDLNSLRDGVALQQAFQEFGADILGTGDDLDVRINFNDFLFSGEDFAIDDIRVTGDVPNALVLPGSQILGGNAVPDSSFGVIDGVSDFSGNHGSTNFDIHIADYDSLSEVLPNDSVRVVFRQSGVAIADVTATVTSTNVAGGTFLLAGGNIATEFPGVTQLVLTDIPGVGSTMLEVGPTTPPTLVSSSPFDEATEVPVGSTIDLTFNEPVMPGAGSIELRRSSDDSLVEQTDINDPRVSFAGTLVSLTPASDLPPGEDLYVNVTPGAIRDLAGNPYSGITDDETLDFSVAIPTDVESLIVTTPGTVQAHVLTPTPTAADPIAYQLFVAPDSGSATVQTAGQFSYSAPAFTGTESFFYEMTDALTDVTFGRVDVQVVDGLTGLSLTATSANDIIRETDQNDSVDASDGDDLLILGSPGADLIYGGVGQDIADYSLASQDVSIQLSSGVNGGAAAGDQLNGIEHVVATTFNDVLTGDGQANALTGLSGNDALNGGAGNDTLDGGSGNDTLNGGAGTDTMEGGSGNDRYFVDSAGDVVIEAPGGGSDNVTTSVDFTLPDNVEQGSSSGSADIAITGNALANFISGNGGNNTLLGMDGADRLIGGAGNDTLEGGADNDILEGQSGANRFVLGPDNGDDQVRDWQPGIDQLDFGTNLGMRFADLRITSSGNEALISFDDPAGGTGSVRLVGIDPESLEIDILTDPDGQFDVPLLAGTTGGDNLAGTAAEEDLVGLAGNDTMNGRAGDDTMLGGFGNDRYFLQDAGDLAIELAFQGEDQVDTQFSMVLPDHIERGAVLGGGAVDITGNELNNFITGSDLENVLIGGDGRDRLIARAGSDTLSGGLDNDVLEGGLDADVFVFEADSGIDLITDFVVGEDLLDVTALGIAFSDMTIVDGPLGALVIFDLAPGSVDLVQLVGIAAEDVRLASFIGAPNLPIVGTPGNDVLFGTIEDDELQGLGGNDLVSGLGGADVMLGGPGNDRYFVNNPGDVVTELPGEGTDLVTTSIDFTLPANVENLNTNTADPVNLTGNGLGNLLNGNDAANTLTGLGGDDNLQGNAGADVIIGGTGTDQLRGGAQADTFVFDTGDGADTIIDFEVGVDTIDLSATGLTFGDLIIQTVGASATVTYGADLITLFNTTAAQLDTNQFDFGP